eukprot:Sspe_Gene.43177::Locus_21007_Transcript_1_2_Confidence_0.500_Length_1577::g.43177::m.43177
MASACQECRATCSIPLCPDCQRGLVEPVGDVTVEVVVRSLCGAVLKETDVVSVESQSPAEEAGLQPGMKITHIDGKAVRGGDLGAWRKKGGRRVRCVIEGGRRLLGTVRGWDGEAGVIEPEFPVFTPGRLHLGRRLVGGTGHTLSDGDTVEFSCGMAKGYLVACSVVKKCEGPSPWKQRISDMLRKEGGVPGADAVCLHHAAGVCREKRWCSRGVCTSKGFSRRRLPSALTRCSSST